MEFLVTSMKIFRLNLIFCQEISLGIALYKMLIKNLLKKHENFYTYWNILKMKKYIYLDVILEYIYK